MQMLKAKKPVALERQNNHPWSSELIEDSMEEILKRLPIKKVFECMSISKNWLYRLLSPEFMKVYRRQHPCYLVMNAVDKCEHERFYYSPLMPSGDMTREPEPEEFVNSITVVGDDYRTTKVTQQVESFFCVSNFEEKRLSLNHVWRGEIMKLPYPFIRDKFNPPDLFFLGFEPVNGVLKLFKFSPRVCHVFALDSSCFDFKILTLDMNCNNKTKTELSWRKITRKNLAPLFQPDDHVLRMFTLFSKIRFSVDGFLFWRAHTFGLVCLDLKEEKFLIANPPSDLRQQDLVDSLLAQFRGQLALFVHNPVDDEKLILWTLSIQHLDDDQGYTYAWTKHFISLPSGLHDRYFPVGNLPTGEILLANLDAKVPFTVVYAYNHETRLFQKFIAGKLSMDFGKLKPVDDKAKYSVCVQPSFGIPDAFGARGFGSLM